MLHSGIVEFVCVAQFESFTQAAKQLQVSTAQVSRQVSALEQRLQVKLLHRTTRRVSLSDEGRVFYQQCRLVLEGLNDAEQNLLNMQAKPQGKVSITAPVTFGEQQIIPLLNDLMCEHEDIQVSVFLNNQQVDLIAEGFDLGIRVGKLQDSRMAARKLGKRVSYVCASPSYIEKFGKVEQIEDLHQHRCMLGTRDYWRFNVNGKQKQIKEKQIKVQQFLRFNSGVGLVDAALKGLGIIQLPDDYLQKYIDSGQLVTMLDDYRIADEGIWAIYPENRYLAPKTRLVIDYLVEHL